MLKPRPYQRDGLDHVIKLIQTQHAFVEASTTGYGKTVIVALAAKACGMRVAVVCPKTVIRHWESTLAAAGIDPLFVLNPDIIKRGKSFPFGAWKIRGKQWNWLLPDNTLLIFDEAHQYRARKTQNAKLLIAAGRNPNIRTCAISATLAESPLHMYATGQLLGLHSGDEDFYHWCKANGCVKGKWGMEYKLGAEGMKPMHAQIFPRKGHRVDASKLEGFPMNQISTISVESDDAALVQRQLDELADKRIDDAPLPIVDRLRARQAVELLKTGPLCELAENDIKEGNNVVLFVNFIESLNAFEEYFGRGKCSVIYGQQSMDVRERNMHRFQNNEVNVIICQIQSGGQSIDLHDLHGRPRVSYICPSDSATSTVQALGRICRSGSLSPAVQRMVFAHGTIEERVRKQVAGKIDNISTLNDGDLDLFQKGQ